ncbi:MAG: hypothetical protein ABI600_06085 [Luteolibacter sp.]
MNLLLHHLRKDLRLMRWPLLFLAIEALGVMLWYSMLPLEKRVAHIAVLPIWRYCIWAACFLIIGGLTQRDAPFREGAFFRTRPVALSTVLRSKCLIALFIVVMFAMIESFSVLMLGLKPSVLDFLLIFCEEVLVLSALGAASMAMAIRQETAGKYFSSVVGWGGILLISWIAFMWCKSAYSRTEKPEWSYTLEYLQCSRLLMAQVVALAGAVIGIVLFVRSGHRETINKSLAVTALCALAVLFFWPLNFVKSFAPPHREASSNKWPDQAKLKFTFEKDRNYKSIITINGGGGYNDVTYRDVYGNARLTGLTDGWRPSFDTSYESKLTLSNGKTISSHREAWADLGAQAIIPTLGVPCPNGNGDEQSHSFELAEFKLEDAVAAMTGAHLKGTVEIPLKRPVILARIPFRQGASIQLGNQWFELTKVETNLDEINYTIIQQRPLIDLRGARYNRNGGVVDFIVLNAGRKEFLYRGDGLNRNDSAGHYSIEAKEFTAPVWSADYRKHPILSDWAAGAELLIIGDENGGSISRSFAFPNIKLSNER